LSSGVVHLRPACIAVLRNSLARFFMNASYHRPAELELCALRRAAPSFDCGQDIEAAFGTMSAGD
jgi:hypothetical protein